MRHYIFPLPILGALKRNVVQLLRLLSQQREWCESVGYNGVLHPGCKQALPAWDSHLTHLLKGQSVLAFSLKENGGVLNNLPSLMQKTEFSPKPTFKCHPHSL